MDAKLFNFSGHSVATGSTGGGSFCIPPDKTPTTVLQLSTRSRCGNDRCFYSELGSEQRFCKPSLVLDQPLLMSSGLSTGKDSVVNSVVEHPVMVPSCSGNAGGSPPSSSRQPEPSVPTSRSSVYIVTGSSTTDRLAHLQKSLHHRAFLEKLQNFSSPQGDHRQTRTTIHCVQHGLLGVSQRIKIPLKDL